MSQEVRRYDYDFGIAVGDTVVLLPVAGEEWVISNVVSQKDDVAGGGGSGGSGERWFTGSGAPAGATG